MALDAADLAQISTLLAATEERLRSEIRTGDAETRRHMGVLIEDVSGRVQLVAEAVQMLDQKVDRLHADHERRLRRLESPRPPRSRGRS